MRILSLFLLMLLPPISLSATPETLVVGTRVAPPFVIENEAGEYEGITIELLDTLGDQQGFDYELRPTSLAGLITGLENGSLDISAAALTVTPEREARIDFSHPFHTTGLAIAVRHQGSSIWTALSGVFSWEFLVALSGLGALLLGVGAALWLFERKRNPDMFGGTPAEGIGASFWWAAVTMTTVGYGDKAPVTLGGRVVGLVWMFAAIILISGFTAAIATSLTVSRLEARVNGPGDLPGVRVVTVQNSSSAGYLNERGIGFIGVDSVAAALETLSTGSADAAVYDAPILRYVSRSSFAGETRVLPVTFRRQDYAIALPAGSDRRESLNQGILRVIESAEWQQVMTRYLGRD